MIAQLGTQTLIGPEVWMIEKVSQEGISIVVTT